LGPRGRAEATFHFGVPFFALMFESLGSMVPPLITHRHLLDPCGTDFTHCTSWSLSSKYGWTTCAAQVNRIAQASDHLVSMSLLILVTLLATIRRGRQSFSYRIWAQKVGVCRWLLAAAMTVSMLWHLLANRLEGVPQQLARCGHSKVRRPSCRDEQSRALTGYVVVLS
jgi:hypothetical protein